MNHVYRLVWSRARGMFVLASEISRGTVKAGRAAAFRPLVWLAALPIGLLPLTAIAGGPILLKAPVMAPVAPAVQPRKMAAAMPAATPTSISSAANPTGGQVTAGSGNIHQSGLTTTIDQHSQNLSLNWLTFNIGADGTVNFVQPNAQAIAVNRIADPNGSVILGKLNANGQVFLINPNGVLFGQGAQVNVGGLVASTLNISDSELASGARQFSGDSQARVVNQGTITADGGYVALVGAQVVNDGHIAASGGTVALGGGNAVTLSFDGNRLLGLQVDKSTLHALAENNQLIVADGGQVLMSAGAKDSLLASVVNNTGTVQAQTVENRDGRIILLGGMEAGITNVAGTLDAGAPNGGNGGFIETSAATVKVADGTRITTSAANGNTGTWLIDPKDYTIAASGGDITGAMLSGSLNTSHVTVLSAGGATEGNGDIFVNDSVSWSSANTLTLTAERNIAVNAAITAANGELNLKAGTGTITLGAISELNRLAATAGSGIFLNGDVTTSGAQAYNNVVTLGADISLTGAQISLAGVTGAANDLTIVGSAILDGGVAGVDNLSLSGTTTLNTASVTTSGAQAYDGAVTLGQNTTLTSTNNAVTFHSTVDGASGLTITANNNVQFNGTVGGSTTLNGLTIAAGSFSANALTIGSGGLSVATQTGGITQGGAFNVAGASSFNANAQNITLTNAGNDFAGAVSLTGGATQIADRSALTLGSVQTTSLTATATGDLTLNGPIDVSTDIDLTAGAAIAINTDIVNTATRLTLEAGTGITAQVIDVASFTLNGGTWRQLHAALPTFKATNFTLAGGSFLRALGGDGTTATPYQLTDIYGLQGVDSTGMLGHHYTLANNIDASGTSSWNGGAGFAPIGNSTTSFAGTFDGLGYTINGVFIDRPSTSNVGPFGYIGDTAKIRNVGLTNVHVAGNAYVGGLVGYNNGGSINNSYSTGQVAGSSVYIGGLVGVHKGSISNSYATATVTADDLGTGGLVGYSIGSISHSYATGKVVGGGHYTGGLVALNRGSISDSYATGTVSGGGHAVGGLVGLNGQMAGDSASISNSYASGNVSGDANDVGGLVGENYTDISNSYATGTVSGSAQDVGGLVGIQYNGSISQTYATGAVNGPAAGGSIGGLVGRQNNGTVSTSYWDTDTTGQGTSAGDGTGLTTTALIAALPAGFSTGIWGNGDNQTTPYLLNLAGNQVFNKSDLPIGAITPSNRPNLYTVILDVNQLQAVGSGLAGRYVLGNAIDASATAGWNAGKGFVPITGYMADPDPFCDPYCSTQALPFTGIFDGLGYTISNLTINRPTDSKLGLFGIIESGAAVRNLGLIGGSISGASQVGGLAGENKGTIDNSYATLNISGKHGTAGGLVGNNGGAIRRSYATGNIIGPSGVGGLVGYNNAVIDNSYSTGNVNGTNYMGGLVGNNEPGGVISNSYATGNVTGDFFGAGDYWNGGLVGFNTAQIRNSYASGSVIGNIYNGGLVGYSAGGGTITESYWNSTANTKGIGTNNNGASATGLTRAEMTQSASFSSWDIADTGGSSAVWRIYEGHTAPLLRAFMTSLTVTGNDASAVYNGTAFAGSSGFTLGPVTPGFWHPATSADPGLVLGSLVPTAPAIDVGSYALASDMYSSQLGYDIDFTAGSTLTITPLAITIGGSALDKIYDGTTTATVTSLTGSGVIAGDVVTFSGGTGDFNDKNVGNGKTVIITGATIGGADAGNYTVTVGGSTTAAITPKAITVDANADDKVYDGTTTATLTSVTSNDVIAGDDVSFAGGSGQFDDKHAGSGKTVTITGVTTGGSDVGNYTVGSSTATAAITPKAITVDVNAEDKVYDGTTTATLAGLTANGMVAGDDLSFSGGSGTFDDKHAGVGKTVTVDGIAASGADAGNYAFNTTATDIADISQLGITVDAMASDKVYDATTAATIALGSSGVLAGDTVDFAGTGTFDDKNAGTGKTVTVDGITASGADTGNYAFNTSATDTADISQLGITVDAMASDKVYDATTAATIALGSSGVLAGDTVDFAGTGTFDDKNAGTGKTVTVDGIAASGADAGNYAFNTMATDIADISQLGITVGATASDKVYDATTAATIALGSSGVLAGDIVDFAGTGTFDDKNAGTGKTVTVDGIAASGADAGNYAFNTTATDIADISQLGITVDATASDKVYDATTNTKVALGSAGILAGDTVAFTGTGSFNDKNVGTSKTVTVDGITASGSDAGNYAFNTGATDTADITPATLTYRADPAAFWAGQTIGGLGGTVTGLLGSDTLDDSTGGTLVWDTQATSSSRAGQYAINGGGLSAGNYVFEQAPGNATALRISNGNAPGAVIRTIAGLQQQDNSDPVDAVPYAPGVHIVDGGVRLP